MPVISRTGRIAMGVDGTVSVDGVLLIPQADHPIAWGRAWLNDNEVATMDGGQLFAIHRDSKAVRVLDPNPANSFYAGADIWASWLAYDPRVARRWGYRDAHGTTDWDNGTKVRDWYPIAVDDLTGMIALLQFGSRGEGPAFWDGQTLRPLMDGPLWPAMNSFHDGEFAATLMDQTVRVWGVNGSVRDLPRTRVQGSVLSRGMRMGLFDNSFLTVHREQETNGLMLSKDAFNFNPDLLHRGPLVIASSMTAGERSNHIRTFIVDFDAHTSNGEPVPWVDLTKPLPVEPPIEPPIEPPVEPPVVKPPVVTITSYAPTSGQAPLAVRAVAALEQHSGPVTTFEWLKRKDGTATWTVAVTNPASDLDHTYQFPEGVWFLAVKAIGPGGSAQTGLPRKVTATAKPVDPPVEPPTVHHPVDIQAKLDDVLAANPDLQKYVAKLWYIPEWTQAPADVTHTIRLSSVVSTERALTIGLVVKPPYAALLDALLALVATQAT